MQSMSFSVPGLDDFAADLVCPICMGEFEDPRLLPCHHYYCAKCINAAASLDRWVFSCPECRNMVEVPNTEPKAIAFPPAIVVNRMKEKLEICRERRGSWLAPPIPNCVVHDCPLKYFCAVCRVMVCPECILTAHKDHDYTMAVGSSRESNRGTMQPEGQSYKVNTHASMNAWYCQNIDRNGAELLLKGKESGTFLCRQHVEHVVGESLNSDWIHTHTVDAIFDSGYIYHLRVLRCNQLYSFYPSSNQLCVQFETLADLVHYYSQNTIDICRAKLKCGVHSE